MTVWLSKQIVLAIHDEQLAEHGGAAGVRDEGLLESALARPLNRAGYGDPDIAELAAVYAMGIVRNHPFVDGNKRTGFAALFMFLALNGAEFEPPRSGCDDGDTEARGGRNDGRRVHRLGSLARARAAVSVTRSRRPGELLGSTNAAVAEVPANREAAMPAKPRVITIEEHYQDPDVVRAYAPEDARQLPAIAERLNDLTGLRIKEMDEAGIDMQVLSHANPGLQKMDAETAVRLARIANDRLAETVRAHPDRFAAFAAIPTPDPKAAADELDRAVTQLGFKGALINGTTNGVFFDDKRFWPICERAAALDVPLYLHPTMPHAAVIDTYYKDYAQDWPMLLRAAWGFTVETATQGVRMVLSGVFDAYPNLKIILGHLGEGLPFLLWRIDMGFARGGGSRSFRDVFCEHFYITTSGFFSNPALLCCVQEMGVDRIMFSVDYPFVLNKPGTDWLPTIPLCAEDKAKIASGNAVRLLKL